MIRRTIRQKLAFWQPITAVLLATLLLTGPLTAHASVQEIRVVAVGVDNSSVGGDEKALDYARKRAVYLAARKLNLPNVGALVQKFTDEDYTQIIRGVNVVQTKRVGNITYSEINVTVVDEMLAKSLKLPPPDPNAASPANAALRGVLVLPVYMGPEHPFLWEKENELKAPLNEEVRRQSHAGLLLPGGDLQDLRLLDYQNILSVTPEELKPMFQRYGAEEIIVAVLKPGIPATTDPAKVLLRRLRADNTVRNETFDVTPETPEEAPAVRLQKASIAIASAIVQIASSTSEQDQELRGKAHQIKVRFLYAIPRHLAIMEEAVRNSPEVLYLDMPNIALARITGTIYLKGDGEALRQSLIKQGIIVREINDGWQLSTR